MPRAVSRHPLLVRVIALKVRVAMRLLLWAYWTAMRMRMMRMKASWNKLELVSQSADCQLSPNCTIMMKNTFKRTTLPAYKDFIIKNRWEIVYGGR
jgi:hypothetical protein